MGYLLLEADFLLHHSKKVMLADSCMKCPCVANVSARIDVETCLSPPHMVRNILKFPWFLCLAAAWQVQPASFIHGMCRPFLQVQGVGVGIQTAGLSWRGWQALFCPP